MVDRGAMTIKEFCDWAGVGLTTAYKEIDAGRLIMRKLGRRSIIRKADAEAWLAELPVGKGPPVSKQEIEP